MRGVYRARPQLDRLVALKVCPTRSSMTRIACRVSSAKPRPLAALNHPHIAQIYRIVHGPADTLALAMEFVEGEDLA